VVSPPTANPDDDGHMNSHEGGDGVMVDDGMQMGKASPQNEHGAGKSQQQQQQQQQQHLSGSFIESVHEKVAGEASVLSMVMDGLEVLERRVMQVARLARLDLQHMQALMHARMHRRAIHFRISLCVVPDAALMFLDARSRKEYLDL
jgi:hypothetical protein